MKKFLFLFFFVLISSSFTTEVARCDFSRVYLKTYVVNDMTYGIFYSDGSSGSTTANISVVNITKDDLECKLLRKQLAQK